jgi:FixJ family two-component response regulator
VDVHAELRRTNLDVLGKLLFMTGGTSNPSTREFLKQAPTFVEKPFDADDLRAVVRARIHAAQPS